MTTLTNIKYRASNGTDFGFDFEFTPAAGWKIYITDQPGYGARPEGAHDTHRYGIGTRPYICWDRKIATIEDAREIAAMWAEATLRYIASGTFEVPHDRPEVRDHGPTPFQQPGLDRLRRTRVSGPPNATAPARRRTIFDRLRGQ